MSHITPSHTTPPQPLGPLDNPKGFGALGEQYLDWLAVNNASTKTLISKRSHLRHFVHWCLARDLDTPTQVTLALMERYQRHLHHQRQANGKPLSVGYQRLRLTVIKVFYRWLAKQGHVFYSAVEPLSLPKLPQSLPKAVLSEAEVERILAQADLGTVTGLRDRAIMEVLYSTCLRRAEVLDLQVHEVDRLRGLLRVNLGKGQKDRVVPIGERALYWLERYLVDSRPLLVVNDPGERTLFVSMASGQRLSEGSLTERLGAYRKQAGIEKPGSVHLFRHSTATLMLENGADIRYIQAMLGHECLSTTQIYTQVAINQLKAVHTQTHPAKLKPSRATQASKVVKTTSEIDD